MNKSQGFGTTWGWVILGARPL